MDPIVAAKILVLLFFAACMIQSGLDKVFDWKGNIAWLTGHFEKVFFSKAVPLMVFTILLMEVVSGFACLASAVVIALGGSHVYSEWSLMLICLTLVFLFTGQRIAKDYVGAQTLAVYFGVALLGLYIASL